MRLSLMPRPPSPLTPHPPAVILIRVMKKDIHPEYKETAISCNGCGTKHEIRATAENIQVEICSNCHPFYTGKQKLVDVAGRVESFRARQAAAGKDKKSEKPKAEAQPAPKEKQSKKELKDLKELK